MMKKQEFVPRKISEKPLYELKSVEDIPVSELYQVKITISEGCYPSCSCTDTVRRRGEQNQYKPSCRKENYS